MMFKENDYVCFSRNFIRNTGQFAGSAGSMKGYVHKVDTFGRDMQSVQVRWTPTYSSWVLNTNLILCENKHKEPV